MNNLTFGTEGPIMEGTWYNPQTGDSFTVRNSFFEDNQYIVQTTDGRVLGYNQIQNYVKSDRPIEMPIQTTSQNIPAEVASILETTGDDNLLKGLNSPLGNLYDPVETNPAYNVGYANNSNLSIIEKALSKRTLPDFQIGVDWKDYPAREISMLMELMDVKEDEIIEWYLSKVDIDTTTLMIKNVIKNYITTKMHPYEDVIIEIPTNTEDVKPTEIKETIKKPKKTSKKK